MNILILLYLWGRWNNKKLILFKIKNEGFRKGKINDSGFFSVGFKWRGLIIIYVFYNVIKLLINCLKSYLYF